MSHDLQLATPKLAAASSAESSSTTNSTALNSTSSSLLKPFLELQPPQKTQEGFNFYQTFRLPLSGFFHHLYNRCYQQMIGSDSYVTSHLLSEQYCEERIHLIDFRPQRWYRELAEINKAKNFYTKEKEQSDNEAKALLEELATDRYKVSVRYLDDKIKSDYKTLNDIRYSHLAGSEKMQKLLDDLETKKATVIQEIAAAGYIYEDNGQKICKRPTNEVEPPLTGYLKGKKLSDIVKNDVEWGDLVKELEAKLIVGDNALLKGEDISRFQTQVNDLRGINGSQRYHQALNLLRADAQTKQAEMQEVRAAYDSSNDSAQKYRLSAKIYAIGEEINLLAQRKNHFEKNALSDFRLEFIKYWNDPRNYKAEDKDTSDKYRIDPTENPLTKFYDENNRQNNRKHESKIYRFKYDGGQFYSQEGQSLQEFMELPASELASMIIILPFVDQDGRVSNEILQAVVGPRKPMLMLKPRLPVIKFVETHQLQVSWEGYSLGALASAVNLFPGEKKHLVIERQTKLTRITNQSHRKNEEAQSHISSSFEDNLRNELDTTSNVTQSDDRLRQSNHSLNQANRFSHQQSDESNKQASNSSNIHWDVQAKASFLFGSFSASAGGASNQSHQSSQSHKSAQSSGREVALAVSLNEHGQSMNKQSRDTASKNVQNRVSKVANDTSTNNKLEVSLSSLEQQKINASNKETVQVENPNVGSTVNYMFYQLQNIYQTVDYLRDVKIVVNTGFELVEGTGIYDIRVYELEEFNKIYSDLNKSTCQSAFAALVSALIAARVLRHYANNVGLRDRSNGSFREVADKLKNDLKLKMIAFHISEELKPSSGSAPASAALAAAPGNSEHTMPTINNNTKEKAQSPASSDAAPNAANVSSNNEPVNNRAIIKLKTALDSLSKEEFTFTYDNNIGSTRHIVNASAYFADAQLGHVLATDPYIVERRGLEIEQQRVKLERERADVKYREKATELLKGVGIFHQGSSTAAAATNTVPAIADRQSVSTTMPALETSAAAKTPERVAAQLSL